MSSFLSESVPPAVGIRVRSAGKEGTAVGVTRARGKRKIVDKHGDWRCEYFSDQDPDRCYTFRIRSRRNDKGELVEAYYGKIYGDFEFEGDDKKGLIGVKFLYYPVKTAPAVLTDRVPYGFFVTTSSSVVSAIQRNAFADACRSAARPINHGGFAII